MDKLQPWHTLLNSISWKPAGLVACVAQQHDTGEVSMLAWMDRAAVEGAFAPFSIPRAVWHLRQSE